MTGHLDELANQGTPGLPPDRRSATTMPEGGIADEVLLKRLSAIQTEAFVAGVANEGRGTHGGARRG